jgi:hypothetical protein
MPPKTRRSQAAALHRSIEPSQGVEPAAHTIRPPPLQRPAPAPLLSTNRGASALVVVSTPDAPHARGFLVSGRGNTELQIEVAHWEKRELSVEGGAKGPTKVFYQIRVSYGARQATTRRRWSEIWAWHKALGRLQLGRSDRYSVKLAGKWSADEQRNEFLDKRRLELQEYFTHVALWLLEVQRDREGAGAGERAFLHTPACVRIHTAYTGCTSISRGGPAANTTPANIACDLISQPLVQQFLFGG